MHTYLISFEIPSRAYAGDCNFDIEVPLTKSDIAPFKAAMLQRLGIPEGTPLVITHVWKFEQ